MVSQEFPVGKLANALSLLQNAICGLAQKLARDPLNTVLNWGFCWLPKMACRKLHCQLNCLDNKSRERKCPWTFCLVLFPPTSHRHSRCSHFLLSKIVSISLRWVKLLDSPEQHTCVRALLLEDGAAEKRAWGTA